RGLCVRTLGLGGTVRRGHFFRGFRLDVELCFRVVRFGGSRVDGFGHGLGERRAGGCFALAARRNGCRAWRGLRGRALRRWGLRRWGLRRWGLRRWGLRR